MLCRIWLCLGLQLVFQFACSVALQCTAAPQGAAQRSAGHRIAPRGAVWCAAAQCSAGHRCQACSAVQCSAVQCCAVLCSLGCWIAPQGAERSSRALRSLGCSSGQRTAPRGAVPPPSGCSVARRRAGRRTPGCRASLLGCSSGQCSASGVQLRTVHRSPGCSSGQSIAPGVQHTVGHRVAPRGAAWGCFAGATLHPRCVFGSRGAATPWCHGSPRGAAPHTSQPRPAPLADACPAVRYLACKL